MFQTLKKLLCEVPILSLPKGNGDFVVFGDTSYFGLECGKAQRGELIVYPPQ